MDWKSFLNQHLLTHGTADAMAGLARASWQLTFTPIPNKAVLEDETEQGLINLDASPGMQIRPNGTVRTVVWEGSAYRGGFAPESRITAVDGVPFLAAALLTALNDTGEAPLHLTRQENNTLREVEMAGAKPQSYPHLERIPGTIDKLTPLLTAH